MKFEYMDSVESSDVSPSPAKADYPGNPQAPLLSPFELTHHLLNCLRVTSDPRKKIIQRI